MLTKFLLSVLISLFTISVSQAQDFKNLTIENIEYLITKGYIEKQLYLEQLGFKIEQEDKNICAYTRGDSVLVIKGEEFTIGKTSVVIFPDNADIKINTCDRNQFRLLFNDFKKGILKSKKMENERFYSFTYLSKNIYYKTYGEETFTVNNIKIRSDVISISRNNPE